MKHAIISILLALFLSAGLATAALTIDEVKADGITLTRNATLQVQRGETLELDVILVSDTTVRDLKLEALITGTDTDDDIIDATQPFDVPADARVRKRLLIEIPSDIERDTYLLRLHLTDRDSTLVSRSYSLLVDAPRRGVRIADVLLNPEGRIEAGNELLVGVRLENVGRLLERDLRVRVSIPELGLSAADYVDDLEPDDQAGISFNHERALPLRIPRCTEPGEYDVIVEAAYNKGRDTVEDSETITVEKGYGCRQLDGPDIRITLGTGQATLTGGIPAQYTLTIFNNGDRARAFSMATPSIPWADFAISPSNTVILEPGQSQTVTVTAIAKAGAPQGTFTLPLTVTGGDTPQTVSLLAAVPTGGAVSANGQVSDDLVTRLVLIGLLAMCLMLGTVIYFSRRRPAYETG
jgi:uncharacterized membrane protein